MLLTIIPAGTLCGDQSAKSHIPASGMFCRREASSGSRQHMTAEGILGDIVRKLPSPGCIFCACNREKEAQLSPSLIQFPGSLKSSSGSPAWWKAWPEIVAVHSPERGLHMRRDASPAPPPVTTKRPSGVKAPHETAPLWPVKTCAPPCGPLWGACLPGCRPQAGCRAASHSPPCAIR